MKNTDKKQTLSGLTEPKSGKSLFYELFFNLCLPMLLLIKGQEWFKLGPKWGVTLAMGFPFLYGLREWIQEKTFNWISFLGLVSVMVKGSVGLFELSTAWLAFNEALLPGIFGGAILFIRLKKRPPFLTKFLFNEQFCHVQLITENLEKHGNYKKLIQKVYFYEWVLAGLFFLSSLLNFLLVKYFVVHPAGSSDFNKELGLLAGWSFVLIALPATVGLLFIVYRFFMHVQKLSHLTWEELLK